MPSGGLEHLRVIVGGGSLGGLFAGLALQGEGAVVDIFERQPGAVETRGAGIVVQDELSRFLKRHGTPSLPTTSCRGRRYLDPGGGGGQTQAMAQRFTSWEAIQLTLGAAFPDDRTHLGVAVDGFENGDNRVHVDIAGHDRVDTDLLVCADGAQSESRRRLLPNVRPTYAGYIAWRGTVDEATVSPDLVDYFDDTFTFSEARGGGHALAYLIPGAAGHTSQGQRRLNWVWYVLASEAQLDRLLTDHHGHLHHNSLPIGGATAESIDHLRDCARREVHPRMAELIEATAQPFIQKIVDVVVPRTVFGRVCLLGDAAFVVRPHTAGATAKAATDATLLASSLIGATGDLDDGLRSFQAAQIEYGGQMHRYGVALGNRWAMTRDTGRQHGDR